jgi:hypothetical protein
VFRERHRPRYLRCKLPIAHLGRATGRKPVGSRFDSCLDHQRVESGGEIRGDVGRWSRCSCGELCPKPRPIVDTVSKALQSGGYRRANRRRRRHRALCSQRDVARERLAARLKPGSAVATGRNRESTSGSDNHRGREDERLRSYPLGVPRAACLPVLPMHWRASPSTEARDEGRQWHPSGDERLKREWRIVKGGTSC